MTWTKPTPRLSVLLIVIGLTLGVVSISRAQRFVRPINSIPELIASNPNDPHTNVFIPQGPTGPGLFYQWRKNDAAATNANLSVLGSDWPGASGRWYEIPITGGFRDIPGVSNSGTNGAIVVNTLDDLRNVPGTNGIGLVYVRGHSQPGDWGKGFFSRVDDCSVPDDDAYSIHGNADSTCWRREDDFPWSGIPVQYFGGTISITNINRTTAFLESIGGGIAFITDGEWPLATSTDGPIIGRSNVKIAGSSSSLLVGDGGGDMFNWTNVSNAGIIELGISNVVNAIVLRGSTNVLIAGNSISTVGDGVRQYGGDNVRIENNIFAGVTNGVHFSLDGAVKVTGGSLIGNTFSGIDNAEVLADAGATDGYRRWDSGPELRMTDPLTVVYSGNEAAINSGRLTLQTNSFAKKLDGSFTGFDTFDWRLTSGSGVHTRWFGPSGDLLMQIRDSVNLVIGYNASDPSTMGDRGISWNGPTLREYSTQDLLAGPASTISSGTTWTRLEASGGAVNLTSTPTILISQDGAEIYLQGSSDANTITLNDNDSVAGTLLQLDSASRVLGKGDILFLKYSGTDGFWYEVSFSDPFGSGGGVAGSDTQVQFNDGGVFGADADFVWNKTLNTLSLGSGPQVYFDGANGRIQIGGNSPLVGLDINNRSFAFGADSITLLGDNGGVDPASGNGMSYILLGSDDGTAANRTFRLYAGDAIGQFIIITWSAQAGELLDGSTLVDTAGVVRIYGDWRPAVGDSISLIFNGTDWIEADRRVDELIDANGNELLKTIATASAVNEFTLANAATGTYPIFSATGNDANIGITISPKGASSLDIKNGTTAQRLRVFNTESGGGANYERAVMDYDAGFLYMGSQKGGTGLARDIYMGSNVGATAPDAELRLMGTDIRFITTGGLEPFKMTSTGLMSTSDGANFNIGAPGATRPLSIHVGTGGITTAVPNSGTVNVKVGGSLDGFSAAVGNVGTGEDTLITKTLAANTIGGLGQYLEVRVFGTFGSNANNKQLKIHFGSTVIFDTGPIAANAGDWDASCIIYTTGSSAQKASVRWASSNALLPSTAEFTTSAETVTGTIVLRCTGEATANNDIVQEGMVIRWVPDN